MLFAAARADRRERRKEGENETPPPEIPSGDGTRCFAAEDVPLFLSAAYHVTGSIPNHSEFHHTTEAHQNFLNSYQALGLSYESAKTTEKFI
ncbi:hypothetical protein JHK85_022944 [Glycine max]|nr:hypothetical protein JHK85_022944 [Glycine max]